mmetsp:Transcript_47689/g.118110  ORF Transcript_47689/g.118110 Transcript_47689/m.118110 type:complete len:211 (+) Transcript_47689:1398-2030(+)
MLLGVQRSLDGAKLVIKVDALLLQPLHDLIVSLPDRLRLVVLDHRFVQPVLERADLSHQWVRLVRRPRARALQVAQLVLQLVHHLLLQFVPTRHLILPLPQLCQLRLYARELRLLHRTGLVPRRRLLISRATQCRPQLLVLPPQLIADLFVLLERQLALLVEGLAVALEQVKPVLKVGELLRRVHGPAVHCAAALPPLPAALTSFAPRLA